MLFWAEYFSYSSFYQFGYFFMMRVFIWIVVRMFTLIVDVCSSAEGEGAFEYEVALFIWVIMFVYNFFLFFLHPAE